MAKKPTKKEEIVTPLPVFQGDKKEQLQQLYSLWYGCAKCILVETREGQDIVFGEGNPDAKIMIIGEGPGEEEERTGIPFVGPSGHLLNQMLALVSDNDSIKELSTWFDKAARTKANVAKFHEEVIKWRNDEFFITNVVSCRPPENRSPTNPEVKACFDRLRMMVHIVDPMLIISVGKTALEALLHRQSEITTKRGQLHEIEIHGRMGKVKYPVMPILHPSYLLRKADWKNRDGDYVKTTKDLYKAVRLKDELMLHYYGVPIPERVEPK